MLLAITCEVIMAMQQDEENYREMSSPYTSISYAQLLGLFFIITSMYHRSKGKNEKPL